MGPSAAAANKTLPFGGFLADSPAVQIYGSGIYSTRVRKRNGGAADHTIVRFDTITGKTSTVFNAHQKSLGAIRLGGGKLVARILSSSKSAGVINVPLDGSPSSMLVSSAWRANGGKKRGAGKCGTYLTPSSVTAAGDVVVESDVFPCRRGDGPRKFLIFRADGTRAVVGDEIADSDQLEGTNNAINTQLTGDRLFVNDGVTRYYELATGKLTLLWIEGVDQSLIATDGSLWLSVFGQGPDSQFWTSLNRANAPFEAYTSLTSNSAKPEHGEAGAIRYLPLTCGPNVLVVSGHISDSADDLNGGVGIFGWLFNLRFGDKIKLDLYAPDGMLVRSLQAAQMNEIYSIGCDENSVTLAGFGRKRAEYARVTF